MNEQFFIFNDEFYSSKTAIIGPSNRGLRYGDGLFETMKYVKGTIINADFHFERLFNGLSLLQFETPKAFTRDFILNKTTELCFKNNHNNAARIRLMVLRGKGGIFDPENLLPNYFIESWEIDDKRQLNENGLVIDVVPCVRKSCDSLSNLKSNNYLPYVMAGFHAQQHRLNDCMVLNSFDRICDSAIANVFMIKGHNIFTPPLTEGCVAGVMREWILEKITIENYDVNERALTIDDLLNADELFLTNSIHHLRWVGNFRNKFYGNGVTEKIYSQIIQTIY